MTDEATVSLGLTERIVCIANAIQKIPTKRGLRQEEIILKFIII